MNKNKIFKIISLVFCVIFIVLAIFSKSSAQINAPVVTGGGSYSYQEAYTVTCSYGPALFYNTLGHAYANWSCNNGTSGGWQCANQPIPGNGGTAYRTVSGTNPYYCTYLSAVTLWSACSNGVQTALDGDYKTITGSSCTNVSTTRPCPTPPTSVTVSTGSCDDSKVLVSWDAVPNAISYKLYKNDWTTPIATITAPSTSYEVRNTSSADQFRVQSFFGPNLNDPNDESGLSTPVQSGNPSLACPDLNATCSVSPNPATPRQEVTWSVVITGGSGSYTYSWELSDGRRPQANNPVQVSYHAPGDYYATTTVVDSATSSRRVVVGCPGTVSFGPGGPYLPSGSTSGGRGLVVRNAGVCDPNKIGIQTVKPTSPFCSTRYGNTQIEEVTDLSDPWTMKKTWSWRCLSNYPTNNNMYAADCSATLNPEDISRVYECSLTSPASRVSINTNTTWRVSSSTSSVVWKIVDNNGTTYPATSNSTLNKIFTTVGLKTVSAKIKTAIDGVYGKPCVGTTSVSQSGAIIEQ